MMPSHSKQSACTPTRKLSETQGRSRSRWSLSSPYPLVDQSAEEMRVRSLVQPSGEAGDTLVFRGSFRIKSAPCAELTEAERPSLEVRGGTVTPTKDHTWADGMVKENKF